MQHIQRHYKKRVKIVNLKLNNTAKTILTISALVVALTGVSLATWLKHGKEVWNSPDEIVKMKSDIYRRDSIIVRQHHEIHDLQDAQEMFFQLLRLMTDDDNTQRWKISIEGDKEYTVDIRNTAEGVELAFVSILNTVYPVYIDHADAEQRKYIIRHHNGQNHSTYLELQ